MAETLARSPENAQSHAMQGWNYLESNPPRDALESFRRPSASIPTWIMPSGNGRGPQGSQLTVPRDPSVFSLDGTAQRTTRWGCSGLDFGNRLLAAAAKTYLQLQPLVLPIIVLYVIFCVLTWIAQPMFNVILRLNRFGRYALSEQQIVASNWSGVFLAAAVVLAVVGLSYGFWPATALAIWFGLMLLPIAWRCRSPARRSDVGFVLPRRSWA